MVGVRSVLLCIVLLAGCTGGNKNYQPIANNAEFLHRSIKAITDRIVYDIFSPPVASRIYAYTCVAAYEAVAPFHADLISLAGQVNGLEALPQPEAGLEYVHTLVSVQAALQVGRALIFSESDLDEFYNQIMNEFKQTGIPDDVFERSVAYGKIVAQHILAWADKDNYKQSRSFPKFTITQDPARWRPTPPAYMDAVEPHWTTIRPFVLDSSTQFMPAPPIPFSAKKDSPFYNAAYVVYEAGKNLTEEQRQIASFWDCNPFVMNVHGHVMFASKKISPGGHWINIVRVACTKNQADIATSAEVYARVALALADGFISCWDEKYRSNLVRPETYINQFIDQNWIPFLQTPPFPEHTSGHSVISTAAAVTLTNFFGDNFEFTDDTELEFGLPGRSFKSFIEASQEAAISRFYGGIHYMAAIEEGVKQGRKVGEWVVANITTRKNPAAPVSP
ncbi:MAG: vanadium-dependent haloperoxidase [Cyclobacteriaceae bacterium]|nr:vanadium-dependent haloperoxidase [Cyclobacteriaceae bacterium]